MPTWTRLWKIGAIHVSSKRTLLNRDRCSQISTQMVTSPTSVFWIGWWIGNSLHSDSPTCVLTMRSLRDGKHSWISNFVVMNMFLKKNQQLWQTSICVVDVANVKLFTRSCSCGQRMSRCLCSSLAWTVDTAGDLADGLKMACRTHRDTRSFLNRSPLICKHPQNDVYPRAFLLKSTWRTCHIRFLETVVVTHCKPL